MGNEGEKMDGAQHKRVQLFPGPGLGVDWLDVTWPAKVALGGWLGRFTGQWPNTLISSAEPRESSTSDCAS